MADTTSEAYVQSLIRLEASERNVRLWRNNVGVLIDRNGRPVRFGLANDSAKLNDAIKSGDLIGWRPRLITMDDVGRYIAQFVSRECKPVGWKPALSGDLFHHEEAQRTWAGLINADGGDAQFATGTGTL